MYTSYYGMDCNPFVKEVKRENSFESKDYKELLYRLNYLKEVKGLGVFTGLTGYGKTFCIRSFAESLNKDLYKVIYITPNASYTLFDFFKSIGDALGLGIGACYQVDMYNNIQKAIKQLVLVDRVEPIIIVDDAHTLSREILKNLKILLNFDMDSKDYLTLILIGQPELKDELGREMFESIRQRVIVNYTMEGLTREEVKNYIETRLELANVKVSLFTEDAINALYSCCNGSSRKLNSLVSNCLILGCQKRLNKLDSEIVMEAKKEMDLK